MTTEVKPYDVVPETVEVIGNIHDNPEMARIDT